MHRTEGSNYNEIAGKKYFTNGPPGTTVEQEWLNAVQEEIAYVIEQAGLVLQTASGETSTQLLAALQVGSGGLNLAINSLGIGIAATNKLDVASAATTIAAFSTSDLTAGLITFADGNTVSPCAVGAIADDFKIYTGGSNRLTISGADGDVGIGIAGTFRLDVSDNAAGSIVARFINSNNSTPNGILVDLSGASPDNTTQFFMKFDDSTSTEAYIWSDGSYQQVSDIRVKKNVVPTEPKLEDIMKLEVVNYNRLNDTTENKHVGIIAQELQKIFPWLITESPATDAQYDANGKLISRAKEDRLMVYKIGLIFPLIKAIQELVDLNGLKTS